MAIVILGATLGGSAALLWPTDRPSLRARAAARRVAHDTAAPPRADRSSSRDLHGSDAAVVEVEQGPVQYDPALPGYDPTKLTHFGASTTEIFEREPRDPQWAPRMEGSIERRIASDLAAVQPAATIVSAECRTSSCEYVIESSEDFSPSANFVLQNLGNGDVQAIAYYEVLDDGTRRLRMHSLFAADHRNLADNASYYEKRRRLMLAQARQADTGLVLPSETP